MDRGEMDLPLAALVRRCQEETGRFQRQEASDERFCLELLRRAICDRDEPAWAAVFAQYVPLVRGWLRQHPARPAAGESDEFWANRVFERLWQHLGPAEFPTFPHLGALLRYLKTCVHGVLIDAARARQTRLSAASRDQAMHTVVVEEATRVVEALSGEALWAAIVAEVKPGAELVVARCCFVEGLMPREVCARHPELFATVGDVHRIKRNVIERLRRSETLRAFWADR
jgi:hypothetical protein